jgi:protein-tyrosine phosphatase
VEFSKRRPGLRHQVYWITRRIALGAFATDARAEYLLAEGITHILNVSDAPSVVATEPGGFICVRDCPVQDLERIPDDVAVRCLDAFHAMLSDQGSKVYIHCTAGQNRSPCVLWLYFVACGLSRDDAAKLITDSSPDAVPTHSRLVDDQLVTIVRRHGRDHFRPHPDPETLAPPK